MAGHIDMLRKNGALPIYKCKYDLAFEDSEEYHFLR